MSSPHIPGSAKQTCFALLDDCTASDSDRRSRLYTAHVDTLSCNGAAALPELLERLQQALCQGKHAVLLFSYELGAALQNMPERAPEAAWAQILLFEDCAFLSADEVSAWLAAPDLADAHDAAHGVPQDIASAEHQAGIAHLHAGVNNEQFIEALQRIRHYIEAGDTYQVNYTYRMHFDAYGSPRKLYGRLRARQPVPYGALIALPDGRSVLSLSPELFLQHRQGELTARPMKGTAATSGDPTRDVMRARALAADPKNRAENLMIVDLLRNDLGRIASPGSVGVPRLFDVNAHSSVLQMTSTVCARVRDGLTLNELVTALFPCGSITGAPKHRTMQIIHELEPDPRGIYTGAIGWIAATATAAADTAIGDFCLSVPIRTLMLQAPHAPGLRAGEMGVGAGITYDSEAGDEYAECQLKARFLTGLGHGFQLIETIHASRTEGCRHLDLHLQRLHRSARYFDFVFDEERLRQHLLTTCAALPGDGSHRLRVALDQTGTFDLQHAPLSPLTGPVRVWLAQQPIAAADLFLRHKTTLRTRYDAAWREAEAHGAFDVLFFNEHGELSEGARSNVFIRVGKRWLTPPLNAGVLPGVMRAALLADPAWNATEQILKLEDLRNAEEIIVCNALRGAVAATVDWDGGKA